MLATIIGWLYSMLGELLQGIVDEFLGAIELSLSAIISSFPFFGYWIRNVSSYWNWNLNLHSALAAA